MHTNVSGPLSFGQLHFWRAVEHLPRERWHEANAWSRWSLPAGTDTGRVRQALRAVAARFPSLRTTYDLTDPARPRQRLAGDTVGETVGDAVDVTTFEHGSAEEAVAAAAAVIGRPFDLLERPAWRALVLTERGHATDVFLVRHHIVADGASDAVLEQGFRAALAGRDAPEPAAGPLDLALWQRDPHQQRARAAAVDRWAQVFAEGAGRGFPGADPALAGTLQCALRSSAALTRARAIAEGTGTSVSTVVLAAYTLAVARVTGVDRLVAESECANRFDPRWRAVVSSMVQRVPIPLTATDDLAEHLDRVHRAAMTAYRRGMYDCDAVALLPAAEDYTATCEYNFFPWLDPTERPDSPEPVWEEPTTALRSTCVLRAAEKDSMLTLCLRTRGIERDRTGAVMRHLRALLT